MSAVGLSCVVVTGSQLRVATIRASSQPLFPDTDLKHIRVLFEWCDTECQEWVNLSDTDTFQAVFLEKTLLWARRVLPSELQRAVAWPAKAFTLLCGNVPFPQDAMVVEFFCDREKTQLYIHETKELLLSEAKSTLSQHPQMLHELSEWEENQRSRRLLTCGTVGLNGQRVMVYNIQNSLNWITGVVSSHNLQSKELILVDDHTHSTHTVNPLMVHVLVQPSGEELQSCKHSNWRHPPPLSLTNSPEVSVGVGSPATPHLSSPVIMECQSPSHFNQSKSFYRTPSMEAILKRNSLNHSQRRASLQHLNSSHMSLEPLLLRRSSLDYNITLNKYPSGHSDFSNSRSLGALNKVHTQSPSNLNRTSSSSYDLYVHQSPHGSNTQLSRHGSASQLSTHGSNSSLNDLQSQSQLHSFPTFPSPEEMPFNERSKSLGNIFTSLGQRPLQHASSYPATVDNNTAHFQSGLPPQKRHLSSNHGRNTHKKPRFELLPTISAEPQEGGDSTCKPITLSRSVSQPAIYLPKNSHLARLKSLQRDKHKHEDDLDIIKQIIDTDESVVQESPTQLCESNTHERSLSLTHINDFSSGSLPILPNDDSIQHVLRANYSSLPDLPHMDSPLSYENALCMPKQEHNQPLTHESRSSSLGDFQIGITEELSMSESLSERRRSFHSSNNTSSDTGFNSRDHPIANTSHTQSTVSFSDCHPQQKTRTESVKSSSPDFGFFTHRHSSSSAENLTDIPKEIHFEDIRSPTSFTSTTASSSSLLPASKEKIESILGLNSRPEGQAQMSPSSDVPQGNNLRNYLMSDSKVSRTQSVSGRSQSSGSTVLETEVGYSGSQQGASKDLLAQQSLSIAQEAEILSPVVSNRGDESVEVEEFSIAKIINQHVTGMEGDEQPPLPPCLRDDLILSPSGSSVASNGSSDKSKTKNKKSIKEGGQEKRNPRGRPRLTEEEKQRRKELRELGLMKRSKRRTKEEVEQWRAEKILTPVKRGRKPGSGKKNIVKAATGKPVFVNVDMSKFTNGSVLLQNGFCRAFPGVSKCLDCGSCDGDLPASRYCRFLEFRKLCIVDNSQPLITVKGFADYADVSAQDLVSWTPLKAGFSSMDESTAIFLLRSVTKHFVSIATEQARALPDVDGTIIPVWRRPVQGIREMCDTCVTSLFNFHWVCPHCGFCICPECHNLALDSEDGADAVSSMQTASWPSCVSTGLPHKAGSLVLAQIIPANVLAEVLVQTLWLCDSQKVQVNVPRVLLKLINTLTAQEPLSKYDNALSKKAKSPIAPVHTKSPLQQLPPQLTHDSPPSTMSESSSHNIPLSHSLTFPSYLQPFNDGQCTVKEQLPHSCSNGTDDHQELRPVTAPHMWLCNRTLLCLLDPVHQDNLSTFQDRWKNGQVVVVTGIHHRINQELWTPESFERDFGDEVADLVDCRNGVVLQQLPCRVFWSGFCKVSLRLRDPSNNEGRLLKLKDWPTCDDFGEKLPVRYRDLMNALPLPDYTRREGKFNLASSLPSFFVKPDLGPKMYCAYGSPTHPSIGTTNLHMDIASAVNVMVYNSIPPSTENQQRHLIAEVVARECCPNTLQRLKETRANVGAIWHIYAASDADKVRTFLRKVGEERGVRPVAGSDPIHDQLMYLDFDLRERLYHEHGVRGWAIAQFAGDAIFIPAGAPHQVRNVCDCIKVALDFVSPEQVSDCLKLTEEFRQLSDKHANHEDKLQVRNIVFHSIKDAVGALKSYSK